MADCRLKRRMESKWHVTYSLNWIKKQKHKKGDQAVTFYNKNKLSQKQWGIVDTNEGLFRTTCEWFLLKIGNNAKIWPNLRETEETRHKFQYLKFVLYIKAVSISCIKQEKI